MAILIYSGKRNVLSGRLEKVIEERCRNRVVEHYVGTRQLSDRLLRPIYDVEAGVLLTASQRDLDGLLSFETIISSLPLILILPDMDHRLVPKAHRLRPRFLTLSYNGFRDVAVVLQKILERARRPGSQQAV